MMDYSSMGLFWSPSIFMAYYPMSHICMQVTQSQTEEMIAGVDYVGVSFADFATAVAAKKIRQNYRMPTTTYGSLDCRVVLIYQVAHHDEKKKKISKNSII
jgi:hypothetical protein